MKGIKVERPDNDGTILKLAAAARIRLQDVDSAIADLGGQRLALETQLAHLTEESVHLRALLGRHEPSCLPEPAAEISLKSGRALADAVVVLLQETGKPMHYREIESVLRAKGVYTAGGKDPANALLALYFADPRLYRPARGTYALRTDDGPPKSVGTKRRTAKPTSRRRASA